MNHSITKAAAAAVAAIGMLAVAAPAFADTSVTTGAVTTDAGPGVSVSIGAQASGDSSTTHIARRAASSTLRAHRTASSTTNHIENGQERGDTAIATRISDLNQLSARINAMKLLPASAKASLSAQVSTAVGDMTSLKATIDADTSTTSMKADLSSITKDYRIYLLVIPQGRVMAAADRVLAVATQMQALSAKFTTRISEAGNDAALVAAHTDFDAKVADSQTQANAAISLVANLQPDNGDTTVQASNTAALKSAAADLKTAQSDLKAARADAETIVKGVAGKKGSTDVSATTSASANQ